MKIDHNINDNCAYLNAFGFHHNPFPVAPDDAFLYMSDTIEEIIVEIVHGVNARKGFIMLTGEVGLGKTTISRRIISMLEEERVATALVLHTNLQESELLKAIIRDFGITCEGDSESMGERMACLNQYLLRQNRRGRNCAIVIDDAQNLNSNSLELVRMISNLESDQEKLVQIILVGQTELATTLDTHAMRQLYSRIVIRKMVRSLTSEELRNYIAFKLATAGNQGGICITQPAYWKLYRLTKGNFRSVNLLMDRCLYALYCLNNRRITYKVVTMAWADLYPEKRQAQKRRRTLASTFFLPVLVLCAAWWLHLNTSRDLMADHIEQIRYHKVPRLMAAMTPDPPAAKTHTASAWHPQDAGKQSPSVNPAVSAFLGIYQLEYYAEAFQKALQDGNMTSLARKIFFERGYQLITLDAVPEKIRKRYGALAFSLSPGDPPTWLLFWRPQLTLKRFYWRYQGVEISQLQKLFSDLKLYRYELDGIVGPRLMSAVVDFQKQQGLPVTGFPDERTLFWICQQREEMTNG